MAEQEFILGGVTEEEYEIAGSRFVTFPPGSQIGASLFLDAECGMPDWDTPGQSIKFPVIITEWGPDKGKEDKVSTGVDAKSLWKLKEVHEAIVGAPIEMRAGGDGKNHPVIIPTVYVGKAVVAHFQIQAGTKGGVIGAERVTYPKLIELLPAGTKPSTESLM